MKPEEIDKYLEFLEEKYRLFEEYHAGFALDEFRRIAQIILGSMRSNPMHISRRLKATEADLETQMRHLFGREVVTEVAVKLEKRYGFGRFGEDPEKILKRVTRRGAIRSATELRVVRDIVSDDSDSLEPAQLEILQGALDDYELGGRGG